MRALIMGELSTVWELAKIAWNDPGPVGQDAFWALVGHALIWGVLWYFGKKLWKWFTK
jgi:hypothetical protein